MYSRGKIIAKLVYGLEQLSYQQKIGDILITAEHSAAFNSEKFAKQLRDFNKNVLRKMFRKGVAVVTRSDSERLHCHLAVEMPSLCKDFDWTSFDEAERYYKLYKKYRSSADLSFYRYFLAKFRRSLPKDWQLINRKLIAAGKQYGLGRVFLTPVRKNVAAYRWYIVSNVPYKRHAKDKFVHFFFCWGVKRAVKFQVLNKYTRDYRRKLKKFSEGLHLTSDCYNIVLRSAIGSNWYFNIRDIIKDIDNLSEDQIRRYASLQTTVQAHQLRSS